MQDAVEKFTGRFVGLFMHLVLDSVFSEPNCGCHSGAKQRDALMFVIYLSCVGVKIAVKLLFSFVHW